MANKEENVTTKFRVDISDLRKNVTEANRRIKEYRAELKNASAGMKKGEENANSLTKKIEAQQKIVEAETKKLELLKSELQKYEDTVKKGRSVIDDLTKKHKDAAAAFGEDSEQAKNFAKQLDLAKAAQERNVKAADDLRVKIINQDTAVKDAAYQVEKLQDSLNGLENELNETDDAAEQISAEGGGLSAFGVMLGNLAANLITAAVEKLGELIIEVLDVGTAFESSMSKVGAISGASQEEFELLTEKARELGKSTQFTASEVSDAFSYMAMAGWETEDMLSGIEGILNLAAASGEDLAATSDIVTDALTAFGLSASDAGNFADILAATSSNSNTNVAMMGETFKYVAPLAGSLGYSVEDVATAIGLMANSGIKASTAGTSLRKIFTELNGDLEISGEKLGAVTISTANADGSMRDLSEVLGDLRSAFSQLSEEEATTAAKTLVGQNALSGFLALVNASDEDFNKLTEAVNNSSGAAENMADIMLDNLSGDLTKLNSAFEGVKLDLYDGISESLRTLANVLLEKIMPSVEKLLNDKVIPTLTEQISKLSDSISNLVDNVDSKDIKILKDLAEAIGGIFLVGKGASLISKFSAGIKAFIPKASAFLKTAFTTLGAEGGVALGTTVLSALIAFIAGYGIGSIIYDAIGDEIDEVLFPIFDKITTGFDIFIGGIVEMVTNTIPNFIDSVVTGVKAAGTIIESWLANDIGAKLVDFFGGIIDFFEVDIPSFFTEIIPDAWKYFKADAAAALDAFVIFLGQTALNAWNKIKEPFKNIKTWFTNRFNDIKSAFSTVGDYFGDIFSNAWQKIKDAFSSVKEFFGGLWDSIVETFTDVGTAVGDAIGSAFKTAINAVLETVENAINTVPDALNSIIDTLNEIPGVDIGSFDYVSLPRLAKGGITDRPVIAGEDGREAIIPLEKNKQGLKELARMLAGEMGLTLGNISLANGQTVAGGITYNFTQTNNSPKALSRWDIYRQTKNLINAAKAGG